MQTVQIGKTTLKAMISMLNAASKDETRYHLCHVKVSLKDKKRIQIEATDGHLMAMVIIEDQYAIDSGLFNKDSSPFYLNKTQIDMLKIHLKQGPKHTDSVLVQDFNWYASEVTRYPNLDLFITCDRSKEKWEGEIGLDLCLLNKVQKVFEPLKEVNCAGRFEIGSKISPIKISFTSDSFVEGFAVVMPIRLKRKGVKDDNSKSNYKRESRDLPD